MPTSLSPVKVFVVTVDFAYIFEQWGWGWADPIATTTKKAPGLSFLILIPWSRVHRQNICHGCSGGTKPVSEKSADID
jgi:hypothetical protein